MVVGGGLKYWPERERGLPPGQGLRSKPLGMAHARWHLPVPWRGEEEGDRPVLCSGAPPAWGCLGMRVGLLSEMPPGSLDDFTRGRQPLVKVRPGQGTQRRAPPKGVEWDGQTDPRWLPWPHSWVLQPQPVPQTTTAFSSNGLPNAIPGSPTPPSPPGWGPRTWILRGRPRGSKDPRLPEDHPPCRMPSLLPAWSALSPPASPGLRS